MLHALRAGALILAGCMIYSSAAADIQTAAEAFRQPDLPRLHPQLTPQATRWLNDRAGLHWPMEDAPRGVEEYRGSGNEWVVAVPSSGLTYCVLSNAQESKWGQLGPARYALIDSTARVLWIRDGSICAPPVVSNSGVAALIMLEGRSRSPGKLDSLRVDFIGANGNRLGTARWGNRVPRYWQRGFEDPYVFVPDGRSFLITINHADRDRHTMNHSILYSVSLDGRIRWRQDLGDIAPNELLVSPNGDRIVVTDLRASYAGRDNLIYVLASDGTIVARRPVRGAAGADGSVFDPSTRLLYAYSFQAGLVAVDVDNGSLRADAPLGPLLRLVEKERSRESNQAAKMLDRVAGR